MKQTVAPCEQSPTSESSDRILCLHTNVTDRIQIIKITNIPNWYFERIVFPGQRLIFEAAPEAELEIHTSEVTTILIRCQKLSLSEIVPEKQIQYIL